MHIDLVSLLAVIAFSTVAVSIDLKTRRIPNWLTVSAAIVGLIYHVATGGMSGLWLSLGGFATGFGVLLVLWLTGSGGGGDVKLMGAVGAWLGAMPTLMIFIGSAAFAAVCTVVMIIWNRMKMSSVSREGNVKPPTIETLLRQTIPYALPVALSIWTLLAIELSLQCYTAVPAVRPSLRPSITPSVPSDPPSSLAQTQIDAGNSNCAVR